jgi:hypothetical protein
MKFFIPKFMKIICYLRIISTFGSDFLIKLATIGLILSLSCVNMSEPKLF